LADFRAREIGAATDAPEKDLVDQASRPAHWPLDVEQQDNALLVGLVPDFVIEGVVEDQTLSLLPMVFILIDADAAFLSIGRHLYAKMDADEAAGNAAMWRDVIAGREDRKERRLQIRNVGQ